MYKKNSPNSVRNVKQYTLEKTQKGPKIFQSEPNKWGQQHNNTNAADMENDDTSVHRDLSDYDHSTDGPDLWLDSTKIIHIHINDRQIADLWTTINVIKISILWDPGAAKSVISKSCVENLYIYQILWACTGICLSSSSGSRTEPSGQVTLDLLFGKLKLTLKSIISQHFSRPFILGLDLHHTSRIRTDWDEHGSWFLHKNDQIITYATRAPVGTFQFWICSVSGNPMLNNSHYTSNTS